ncbi:TfdA family Taurine catabolism dioxygenase TauD, variant [Schizosaccharomyces cryophilus OY26]|uniref:TfdA family Taurine catabolism dioxygenase TauD, variant n=1 Tax=Schizosaccharomyces cryophilus (strain OY26 / ATCC MYA-4695 / CBS 11777 / NBRC 106824 / NRRL Y48691) TaxID=653667 RepID=S9X5F7_SCHCR|nr:TfdA family Taurine catabolism dioxygenase TauD, variant [Schizosaccharomyces cryophilus OY26]EPY52312.1 TfdA family Taurine catabolism dioxygenase TauD, variant [Schizosaccharomyces cryophilus OY26]
MSIITEPQTINGNATDATAGQQRNRLLSKINFESHNSLNREEFFDLTPSIGREYPQAQLSDWITAEDSDELLKELAITVSNRGVVFFRNQNLSIEEQKILGQRLGELTGKPKESSLHIHPVINAGREGVDSTGEVDNNDNEVSILSKSQQKTIYPPKAEAKAFRPKASAGWHSDITFEPVPADYTILKMQIPSKNGGDTLWASGHELYTRFSPHFRRFLDGLTATYAQPRFNQYANAGGFSIYDGPRGSPHNTGEKLEAVHPVIRTNPITGLKSVFAVGHHVEKINDVTSEESEYLLNRFIELIAHNHDLQVRFKWKKNDLAIWDNRSVYHTATYDAVGPERVGIRVVGIGEKPYFDPNSRAIDGL